VNDKTNNDSDNNPEDRYGLSRFAYKDLNVSFEFFPPKDEKTEAALWKTVKRLEPLGPKFVSVTYGAGGSTRHRTHNIVKRMVDETTLKPAAHLTCVGATQDEVNEVAQGYLDAGINHIVALRGDPPEGSASYQPHPGGYDHAVDLVGGLKKTGDFEISVAAYPELHPDAPSAAFDMDNLKRKIDAGATRAITQFFFETETYLRYLDRVRAAGITVPIIPGILPVSNFAQAVRIAGMCGTNVPKWMHEMFDGLDDEPDTRKLLAAMIAFEQCQNLVSSGVRDIHFYTLNRPELTYAICLSLGLRPRPAN
jgi:methylenetetrahydrofolate reductase (NADPH)